MRRPALLVAGLCGLLALGGCGVEPQSGPVPVPADRLPSASPQAEGRAVARGRVWGARDQRLVPVFVQLPAPGVEPRMERLLELAAQDPQPPTVILAGTRLLRVTRRGVEVEVELGPELLRTRKEDLPLVLAQVVFTVTEEVGVEQVRVLVDGRTVPYLDESGREVSGPLRREDLSAFADEQAVGEPDG